MPTFLQAVAIPERCFLQEVLLWVAVQRLPLTQYDSEGVEFHDSAEIFDTSTISPEQFADYLSDEECTRLGIPPDPKLNAMLSGTWELPPSKYDEYLRDRKLDKELRAKFETDKKRAEKFESECRAWKRAYEQSVEYPTSRIFVLLKEGSLNAWGRKLPSVDLSKAEARLERQGERACDLPLNPIPAGFWSLKGIDFDRSTARNDKDRYCHIVCSTSEILAAFPGERQPVGAVVQVGDSYLLSDPDASSDHPPLRTNRGRPPYPWDGFHLAVTELVKEGTLPQKKEAAIQQLQDWFFENHGLKPSRAAIGERLTPYYAKFIRSDRK